MEQTTHTNMLTEACKLYLESDYILAAMRALENFTYHVTMPYLNFVEQSDQNMLVGKIVAVKRPARRQVEYFG